MEMDLDGLASLAVQDELELLLRGSIRVTQASANAEGILKLYASLMDQMQRFYGVNGRMIYFNGYEIPNYKQITTLNEEEVLIFCQKNLENLKLKPATLNSFRNSACKFKEINGFDNFSEYELLEFKKLYRQDVIVANEFHGIKR
jgi:hypothetical protein